MKTNESRSICNGLGIELSYANIQTLTLTIQGGCSVHTETTYWFALTIHGPIGIIN